MLTHTLPMLAASLLHPRLLNAEQAAAYLGLKSRQALQGVPVQPVRIGSRVLYDLAAINLWLDSKIGPAGSASSTPAPEPLSEAEAAYARWSSDLTH